MTQLIPDITGVVVDAIITICGLIFTGVFIPWLVKTGIPWLKEKHLYTIVSTFVKAAEKMASAGSLTIPKLDYVEQMLEAKGIKITPEVRAVIEAAVQDLDIAIDGALGTLGNIFVEELPGQTETTVNENT
ncbi:MAG: phage holin, LLH family [Eubacteriales bacterium]|nr:phage holin, LLH family [Eubacteriales bacterium]